MLLRAASRCFSFAGCTQQFAQFLADNHFFALLDRPGKEFAVVDALPLFSSGFRFLNSFANGWDEAWIVRAENFDDGIAGAQLVHAIWNRVAPGILVPGYFQRGVTVSVVGNINAGSDARNSFDEFGNAIDACVPFVVKFLWVNLQPGFHRSQGADYFFLADFHRAANS